MKISFVYRGYENVGIQMLSACLQRAGHETKLHFDPLLFDDMLVSNRFLSSLFSHTNDVLQDLFTYDPDVVCFSVVTFDYSWAIALARKIRSRLPQAKIVFGGIHVTSVPDQVLANDVVDYIVIGEGEFALVELVDALAHNADTAAIANVGGPTGAPNPPRPLIQDLDSLPLADKELYYRANSLFKIGYAMVSGRGCPNKCTYCHNNVQSRLYAGDNYLRRRSVASVLAEFRHAKKSVDPFMVRFSDDNFCYNPDWLDDFAAAMTSEASIPFWCFIHPGNATEHTIHTLKKAGCIEVQMGVQTLDQHVREKVIGRTERVEQIASAIDGFRRAGIRISTDFIINLPGHDENNLLQAVSFFAQHPPHRIHTFWLSYFPSLSITNYALTNGLVTENVLNAQCAGASPNTFFRGGSVFNKRIAKTQLLFLLASRGRKKTLSWMMKNARYQKFPFIGFTLFWFLTYTLSLWSYGQKNDLYSRRMRKRYKLYGKNKLRQLLFKNR